ncbi:MAG: YiiD C-terminal domain-containing protein [Proteobacteria bacterium]|nr:YiiD C-terminal domain-containing protein [Pseudomonadota bacterium]
MSEKKDFSTLVPFIEDTIPIVKYGGVKVEKLEERDIILSMPTEKNLNHVGIMYAGSTFILLEMSGAALFATTYDIFKYILINSGMSIKYLKPATSKISCHLKMTQEEADKMMKPIEERGKGIWPLKLQAVDENGVVVAEAECNYYVKVNA